MLVLLSVACAAPTVEPDEPVAVAADGADPAVARLLDDLTARARAEPTDPVRRAELGMAYDVNGFLDAAARSYEQAAALDPQEPRGQERAGEVPGLLGPLVGSEAPPNPYANQILAAAYRDMGRLDQARELLAHALPAGGNAPGWRDPWSEEKARFLAGFGADMLQGEALLAAGRSAEAIAVFERLRVTRPEDVQLLNNLAVAYRRSGRQADARTVLENGVERHPGYFPFRMNLGNMYEMQGDFVRALEQFDRAAQLNPTLGVAHLRRANLLVRLARVEEALDAYGRALACEPGNALSFLRAGQVAAGLDHCQQAAAWLEASVRIDPRLVPAYVALGDCRARLGDLRGAREALRQATAIDPAGPGLDELRMRVERSTE